MDSSSNEGKPPMNYDGVDHQHAFTRSMMKLREARMREHFDEFVRQIEEETPFDRENVEEVYEYYEGVLDIGELLDHFKDKLSTDDEIWEWNNILDKGLTVGLHNSFEAHQRYTQNEYYV